MPKPFYGIRVGHRPGVYGTWEEAEAQVKGYKGAVFKGFDTEAEAVAFVGTVPNNTSFIPVPLSVATSSVPVTVTKKRLTIQPATLPVLERVPREEVHLQTIYVDGGHNKQTGKEAWGCVVDEVGCDLIAPHVTLFRDWQMRDVVLPVGPRYVFVAKFNDVKTMQNNGAELLAMVGALRLAEHYKEKVKIILSDSLVVMGWSQHFGEDRRKTMDPRKVALIDECIVRRRAFEARGGQVLKVAGNANKGDLGYHH